MHRTLLLLGMFLPSLAWCQNYGNEWVDHGRRYWRFKVAVEAIHRIDSTALANAGFPVATVDPRHIMVFGRERQVPIFVQGEEDGVFNSGDHIEFHARRNDGWMDTHMWDSPDLQANPNYSLYNDTIQYYLTWDEDAPKERVVVHDDTDYAPHPIRDWMWYEGLNQQVARYYLGERITFTGGSVTSSRMVSGEGWFASAELQTTSADVEQSWLIPVAAQYTGPGAPAAQCEMVVVGTSNEGGATLDDHHLQVFYGAAPGVLVGDTIYRGYRAVKRQFLIPPDQVIGPNTTVRMKILHDLTGPGQIGSATPDYPDRQAFAYAKLRYARQFNMMNLPIHRFWLTDLPGDAPSHIDFGLFPGTPILYAYGDTVRRLTPTFLANRWKAMVPAHPQDEQTFVFLCSSNNVVNVQNLVQVNGNGFFTDLAALDVDSAMVIVTHPRLMNGAMQYAAYRQSNPYNRFNTVVVDVEELYDQFGGGVPKHAEAIRRFSKYIIDQWSTMPQALFLVGKSVQTPTVSGSLVGYRNNLGAYANCLLPSYGYPTSDNAFTMGLTGDPRLIAIPVGRLAASSDLQVTEYLAKVQALEGQPRAAWMKNVLHFRGGLTPQETVQLSFWLDQFKQIAVDTSFGANVIDFVKTGNDLLEQASADSVRMFIDDQGVALMTFFAHASGGGFDINIDNPANYEWNGKHPIIVGNSCYAGNIHLTTSNSASEQFVMIPNKGSVAFLSSVDIGITSFLGVFTRQFYRSFGQVRYGGTIGEHIRFAGFEQLQGNQDLYSLNNVQTFTLHGDPTLRFHSAPLPDYAITAEEIFIDPEVLNATVDTFTVRARVTNIGKAVNATIPVALERVAPGLGQPVTQLGELTNVHFQATTEFTVPTLSGQGGQGPNTLTVRVDLDPNEVPEEDDFNNNVASKPVFITSNDLIPIWPYDYAITPDASPVLRGSTGDPFAAPRNYRFQIDTTDTFDSPVMESAMVNAPGGVVTWQPQTIYQLNSSIDSLVFFWRCAPDTLVEGEYPWYERSFQHITGREGWGQAHFFQFKNNHYNALSYARPEREFQFFTGQRNLRVTTKGNPFGQQENQLTAVFRDLETIDDNGCQGQTALHVAVFDPITLEPWGTQWNGTNPENDFGNLNNGTSCRNRVEYFFIFQNNATQLAGMQNMLNTIPDGHYMFVFTWRYLNKHITNSLPEGTAVLNTLENLGATNLLQVQDSVPYILFLKKGDPSTALETWGANINDFINISVMVDAPRDRGVMTTMRTNFASAWHGLYWDAVPREIGDSTRIKVIGVTDAGMETLLLDLPSPQDSVPDLGTMVDAAQYPQLKLQAFLSVTEPMEDPDPAQMDRWQLLMSPVPECAIDPPLGFVSELNDLFEGQMATVAVAVHNISAYGMDSLLIGARVLDRNNVVRSVHYRRNAPLPAGAFVLDTIRFDTRGFPGTNTLIIEANPVDTLTGVYDQREQYRFNNIAELRFFVEEDVENPLLDVTFDGIHILDGDIVSARPEILISLRDENPVLLFDSPSDTAYFKVFLTPPDGQIRQLYFRDGAGVEVMQFVPTAGPENEAKIFYRPNFDMDGRYTLTVQATDISLNQSGDRDYRVRFEVVNRPTITEVLNYPNPFTTSTRFVFTVTGHEAPTYMKIQIMTITGRVVREVRMHELGPIRVGRNITEFAWDGTDEFGDRLARGVYLYRVIAQLHGQDIEYRSTGASEYFTKGFGKMYLLR